MENVPIGVLARPPGQRIAARHAKAADIYRFARLRGGRQAPALAQGGKAPRWCFVNVPMLDISSSEIRARGDWGGGSK